MVLLKTPAPLWLARAMTQGVVQDHVALDGVVIIGSQVVGDEQTAVEAILDGRAFEREFVTLINQSDSP